MLNIEAMNSLISRYGISSQTAGQLMSGLDKINFNAAIANSMGGELILNKDMFELIIAGKCKLPAGYINDNKLRWIIEKYSPWPFLYQDYACYLKLMLKIRQLYSQPYWFVKKQIKELENELSNVPSYYLLSKDMSTISVPALCLKISYIESEIDAAKLTLALHIYKNQHGEFPNRLEELAPEILKEIPVDPISGKPFEYSKTGNTFTISSVWLKEKAEIYRKNRSKHNSGK